MKNVLTRQEVYARIDGERDYQDFRHGDQWHSPEEWLRLIQDEALAAELNYSYSYLDERENVMAAIRKIAGLCVVAMEQNGAAPRAAPRA